MPEVVPGTTNQRLMFGICFLPVSHVFQVCGVGRSRDFVLALGVAFGSLDPPNFIHCRSVAAGCFIFYGASTRSYLYCGTVLPMPGIVDHNWLPVFRGKGQGAKPLPRITGTVRGPVPPAKYIFTSNPNWGQRETLLLLLGGQDKSVEVLTVENETVTEFDVRKFLVPHLGPDEPNGRAQVQGGVLDV
jgi:hypothetical protein